MSILAEYFAHKHTKEHEEMEDRMIKAKYKNKIRIDGNIVHIHKSLLSMFHFVNKEPDKDGFYSFEGKNYDVIGKHGNLPTLEWLKENV